MHKLSFVICCLFLSNALLAQETTKTTVSPEVKEKINKAKDRVLLEFGLSQMINRPDNLKISALSRTFNAYFTYDVVFGKSNFSIAPGAGIGNDNFYHKKNGIAWGDNTHLKDTSGTSFPLFDSTVTAKKSKLGLTYFDVPIELRFRSKPNKKDTQWKLAAGFKLGFLLGSKWKYRGEDLTTGTGEVKFKDFKVDNLNKLRYSVYLRGGYGIFNLFVNYQISSTFQKDKGPQMQPLTFGIAICGL